MKKFLFLVFFPVVAAIIAVFAVHALKKDAHGVETTVEQGDSDAAMDVKAEAEAVANKTEAKVKPRVPAPAPLFQQLPVTSVVVRIDGHDTTKADILRDSKAIMTLYMNKARTTAVGRRERQIFIRNCYQAIGRKLNAAAVALYAKDHAISVPSNIVAECVHDFTRKYGVRSKKLKRWHTVDDLKYMLRENAGYVDRTIAEHARHIAVTNHIATAHPVVVTDKMIADRLASIARGNREAAQTNALIFAQATNVWKKIVGGKMTLEAAATKYSQDAYIDEGCEWGTFSLDQIADDPNLLMLLPTLKAGSITPPIESDNGLAIIRLDEISEDKKNYTFSRVFFQLPMFFDEETPDEARAHIHRELELDLIRKTLEDYRDRLKVEYPSGKELFAPGTAPLIIRNADMNP